jgi:hypothetical protein
LGSATLTCFSFAILKRLLGAAMALSATRWWGSRRWIGLLRAATHAWHKPGKVRALRGCEYQKIEILIRGYDGIVGRGYRWMRVGPFFEAACTAACQRDAHQGSPDVVFPKRYWEIFEIFNTLQKIITAA